MMAKEIVRYRDSDGTVKDWVPSGPTGGVVAGPTGDVVAVAPVVGEKTITQTAAALFAGSSALANRQFMRVRNLSLDQQVLFGPSTVGGAGFPVEPGGEFLFKFNKEVAVPVYAMSPGAAVKVRVMEA